jgi:NADH dehydrogenase
MPQPSAPRRPGLPTPPSHDVLIIGAGFAGLACAQALGGTGLSVTLVDRNNYHLFVPLVGQVATAGLAPSDVSAPIRELVARHGNIRVLMADVTAIDPAGRTVTLDDGTRLSAAALVIAAGSSYAYPDEDWLRLAPGPRDLPEASALRARILMGFELAERAEEEGARQRLMTSVVVGGGPTGVEMAGGIAELCRDTLVHQFTRIDPARARVILVETGDELLSGFAPAIRDYARRRLEALGVELRLGARLEGVTADSATIDGEAVPAHAIVWSAGVRASDLLDQLGRPRDGSGRVAVDSRFALPGCDGVHVIGDCAAVAGPDGEPLPQTAQAARQQGAHLAEVLLARHEQRSPAPFRYRNRGSTAVIGRNAAGLELASGRTLTGLAGWLAWAVIHVWLLMGFERRTRVVMQWGWRQLTGRRVARLILMPPRGSETPDPDA